MDEEALVLMEPTGHEEVLARLAQRVIVTQSLLPRLAVIAGERADFAALREVPGVADVFEEELPERTREPLAADERLFADAWVAREGGRRSLASAISLAWDAPGCTPPDPPGWMGEGPPRGGKERDRR